MVFNVIGEASESPFIITAEHASNKWPADMDRPDFPAGWEEDHIAYDKGVGPLAKSLAERLKCTAILGEYSRLLVDLNRSEDGSDLIVSKSDQTILKSNQALTSKEIERRVNNYYRPYHRALSSLIEKRKGRAVLVSLHSFTPRLRSEPKNRPWHVGVLYKKPNRLTAHVLNHLHQKNELCVGDNQPYDLRVLSHCAATLHAEPLGIDYVEIEIRNDQFNNLQSGVLKWSAHFTEILQDYLAEIADSKTNV